MFGKRLKELRDKAGYSMDKLVELYNLKYDAKMNKSTLSRYENGLQDPLYTVVVNFAEFFNVSVDYLSGGKDEDYISSQNTKPAENDGLEENVVIYHRNGKTERLKLSKDKMDMFAKMIEAFKDDDVDL